MAFANSENIQIFPISKDRANGSGSRLLSEEKLSSIFKKLVGTPSCIVDYRISTQDNSIVGIDFLLDGRYISLTDENLLKETDLYVRLQYSSTNDYVEILDTDAGCKGIEFNTSQFNDKKGNGFQLISNGQICEASFRKTTCQIIDGGEI